MLQDPADVSAISIDVASRFLDALADFRAQLPDELAAECSSLDDALATERVWVDVLANAPVVLITGNEPSVARVVLAEILGSEGLPARGTAFLIGDDRPGSRSQGNKPTVECLVTPGHRLFGRQVLYVPDFQRLERDNPAAAKSMANWSCVAAAIASAVPDWLAQYDRPCFLIGVSSVIGQVCLIRVVRGPEISNHIEIDATGLWLQLEESVDRDAWPRRVLKMFQRLAAPIGEVRDAMALHRLRVGKRKQPVMPDLIASRLQRCGDVLVGKVSKALLSISDEVWSSLSGGTQHKVSVEERVRHTRHDQKSWLRIVIENVLENDDVFDNLAERERIERVTYQVSAELVEEFKAQVETRLRASATPLGEIAAECADIERELESRVSAIVALNDEEVANARTCTHEALQGLLSRCGEQVVDSARELVSELPCRSRSFSKSDIDAGLAGVVKERLRDRPIRNPIGISPMAPKSGPESETEAASQEFLDALMAPWCVKPEKDLLSERLVRLEEEARELVGWAGTLELATQEDLRSLVSKVRRAARVSLERAGQSDGIASSFARSIAGIFGDELK